MKKTLILSIAFILFLLSMQSAFAAETEELNKLIAEINEKQTGRVDIFQQKLENYFFDVSPKTIKTLLHETSMGESAAILCLSRLAKKSVKGLLTSRKNGVSYDEIVKQSGLKTKDLISAIEKFRKSAGC
ncbi:MAG: hypothetical protein HY756_07405 [Nitrospirae bacterium]|nr:hypothetical protein [Nitrospirota bacterium]